MRRRLVVQKSTHPIVKEAKAAEAKCKRAEKLLKGWGFTPLVSGRLAVALCSLIGKSEERRQEALDLFARIAKGDV